MEATAAMRSTGAKAVVLIVLGGRLGNGFEVQAIQAERFVREGMPIILREMADKIEQGQFG